MAPLVGSLQCICKNILMNVGIGSTVVFWEPELPFRSLNTCLAHIPVK